MPNGVPPEAIAPALGLGEAVIFKPAEQRYIEKLAELEYAEGIRKKKEEKEIVKGIPDLDKLDIFFRDQDIFAEKLKDLYGWTSNNMDRIREDPKAQIEFQERKSNLQLEVQGSKYSKDVIAKPVGKELLTKGDEYTPESHVYFNEYITTPGMYEFDYSKIRKIKEKTDWWKDFQGIKPSETGITRVEDKTIVTNWKANEMGNAVAAENYMKNSKYRDNILFEYEGDEEKAINDLTTDLNRRSKNVYAERPVPGTGKAVTEEMIVERKDLIARMQAGDLGALDYLKGIKIAGKSIETVTYNTSQKPARIIMETGVGDEETIAIDEETGGFWDINNAVERIEGQPKIIPERMGEIAEALPYEPRKLDTEKFDNDVRELIKGNREKIYKTLENAGIDTEELRRLLSKTLFGIKLKPQKDIIENWLKRKAEKVYMIPAKRKGKLGELIPTKGL